MSAVSLPALEGLTGRLVTLGLVHSLWVGLLVASVTAIVLRAFAKLSLAARHRILAVSLALIAIAPILIVAAQRVSIVNTPRPISVPMSVEVRLANEDVVNEIPSDRRPVQTAQQRFDPWQGPLWTLSLTLEVFEMSQPLVLAAWLCGVVILSARLGLGFVAIHHRVRRTVPAPKTLVAETRMLADAFKLRRVPAVRVHPGPIEPYLCGIFRPVIVLPALWLKSAAPSIVAAILAHELAHVKRRDLLANLLQRLVDTALFFHPSVQWLSRSLRCERERSTDALTVRITGDPYSLASALESVARFRLTSDRRFASFVASLGGEPPSLLPRIQELLGMMPNNRYARRSIWPWISLPVAGLFALVGASLGLAQEPVDAALRPRPLSIIEIETFARSSAEAKVPLRPQSISQDVTKLSKVAKRPLSWDQASDRQICYEVRVLSIADMGWRDSLAKHIREVHRDEEATAWILDPEGTKDLVVAAQRYPRSAILMAPKVTTFEGHQAQIDYGKQIHHVADLEKLETAGNLGFRPIMKAVDTGFKINVSGVFRGSAVLVDADLRYRSLVTMNTMLRRTSFNGDPTGVGGIITGEYQSPVVASQEYKGQNVIPKGSSLLITTGFYEVPNSLPPMMNKAIGVVRTVIGGPPVEARPTICERLIAITPWAIRLEPENGAASPATSKDKTPAKNEAPMKPIQIQGTLNGQIVPFPSLPTPLHP